MKRVHCTIRRIKWRKPCCAAFSLAEMLAALAVGSLVLVAVLAMHNRAYDSITGVLKKVEAARLPAEVQQRIAEDLDALTSADRDVRVRLESKLSNGITLTRLGIVKVIRDSKNQPLTVESILWQTDLDPQTGILTLYRSHGGLKMEDKLLDERKESYQREYFIPVCEGLTMFKIQVVQGSELVDQWTHTLLPPGLVVTMSFGEQFRTTTGFIDVAEQDKVVRTIAVDRTRKIQFNIPEPIAVDANDANQAPRDSNQPAPGQTGDAQDSDKQDVPGIDEQIKQDNLPGGGQRTIQPQRQRPAGRR